MHDTFLYKGGGERLILMMGKVLEADIASGFFSRGSFDLRKEGFTGKMIPLSSEVFKKWFRHLKLKWAFVLKTRFIREYDTVIFSGDCISAVRNCSKNTKKIYYCHTPPRYIYDLHSLYLEKLPVYMRPFFRLWCKIFKYLYERDISKMDIIITNSENTKRRIKEFLGYDAVILYPPVDTQKFKYISQKNYFLSFARLADAKRVDRIVEAFQKLPDQKLIIIYGKNDPQREKIFSMLSQSSNIECITLEDNDELYRYLGEARASIYIPVDEDFGMSPVESMAAGKPVIGVDEGGLKESIIPEKTGILIPEGAPLSELVEAIEKMTPELALSLRENCQNRAQDFSLASFSQKLHTIIQ